MDAVLLAARIVLAVVFAVAGAAKLADRRGSRRAAAEFGVPARFVGLVAIGLPLAELAVASALLPARSAVWAAIGALVLLAAFCAAISINLARGRAPDCHCFGQLHSEPAGWRTLARNAALAAAATFVLIGGWSDPGLDGVAWIGRLDTPGALAAVALASAVALAVAAALTVGRLRMRIDALETRVANQVRDEPVFGLPVGVSAPEFALRDVDGEEMTLTELRSLGKAVLLLFTDPGCGPCQALITDIVRWQEEHDDLFTAVMISGGSALDSRAKAEEHGLEFVLCDEQRMVYRAYEGAGTPSAVLIHMNSTIASPLAVGPTAVTTLVEQMVSAAEAMPKLPLGEAIPDLAVENLDGVPVSLSDFRGSETLFLFWSPKCPYCRAMHEEVLEWEAAAAPDAPRLVVISAGTVDEVREEGFGSPVLRDPKGKARESLGGEGTPSAILVDAEGRVAWPLAIGSEPVWKLLRSRSSLAARV